MLSSIRSAGKALMSRIKAAWVALKGAVPDFTTAPLPANALTLAAPAARSRTPHSNDGSRYVAGVPHGVPGAKLARKAAAGTVGKATLR